MVLDIDTESKKYDEMESISLIKQIRKISDKKLLESEMNFDKLDCIANRMITSNHTVLERNRITFRCTLDFVFPHLVLWGR